MKRLLIFSSLGVVVAAAGATAAWRTLGPDAAPPNASPSGDPALAPDDPRRAALDLWWRKRGAEPISITVNGKPIARATPTDLGVGLDAAATLAAAPQGEDFTRALEGAGPSPELSPAYVVAKTPDAKGLKALVAKRSVAAPAKVTYANGAIVRKPETTRSELDAARLPELAIAALKEGRKEIEAPLQAAPKRVPDDALAQMTDVVSTFSTKFDAGNRPRSSNIRLAMRTLDGRVLLPGEVFSYNDALGERTLARGYKVAGVYVNGRRDTGVGGGICQVSTTLYDAALYANLGIVERRNHSLPVPYVPLGQDAVVDYGNLDLKFKNTTDVPIGISATYEPGRITFRLIGKKVPGQSVTLRSFGFHYGAPPTERVVDRSLPPGATRVRESGGSSIACKTSRIVKQNGIVVKREALTSSHYLGNRRVIAYNPARRTLPKPAAKPPPPTPPPPSVAPPPSSED